MNRLQFFLSHFAITLALLWGGALFAADDLTK